jgi:hypothetical protein
MRETIRFSTNVPAVVALAFDEGKDVEGRFGDQVMYSLQGERVMYVPPIVRDRMVALGIKRNDPIRITKAETKDGNRKGIQWFVERVEPEEFVPEAVSSPAARRADETVQVGPGNPGSNGKSSSNGPGGTNGNGHATHNGIPYWDGPTELLDCYREALDLASKIETVAAERKRPFKVSDDKVGEMAATLFIERCKRRSAFGGAR